MRVVVQLEYKADRKEPLGDLLRRIADAFDDAVLEPVVVAAFSDKMIPGGVSAVARALKKHPALERFDQESPLLPGGPPVRSLMNAGPDESFPLGALFDLADGIPRSFPFDTATVMFKHERFGDLAGPTGAFGRLPGVIAADRWWVNGRMRSLTSIYVVEGDAAAKALPPPPAPVATVLAALGKARRTSQYLLPSAGAETPIPGTGGAAAPAADAAEAFAIGRRYRQAMPQMVDALDLPHRLPPVQEALRQVTAETGPLKPALVEAFEPRGYGCRFESGTFTLRRRTPHNHVVDLVVDVGTWSHLVSALYLVHGPGFRASLPLPVSTG